MTDKQQHTPETNSPQTAQPQRSSSDEQPSTRALTSRRSVLAVLTAIGAGGVAVSQFGSSDSEDAEEDPTEERAELLQSREVESREQLHANRHSLVPSFDYSSISETYEDPDTALKRALAEPATEETGDRFAFVLDSGVAPALADSMIGLWTEPTGAERYPTAIDGETVVFDIYTGAEIVVGVAIREPPAEREGEELLVGRATDKEAVERLLDTFDTFYEP